MIGTKYGLFSKERFAILRDSYIPMSWIVSDLVWVKQQDTKFENKNQDLTDIMENLKIHDKLFNFTVYKN